MSRFTDQDLFDYLDGSCSKSQKRQIEQELREDKALRKRYDEFLALDQSMAQLSLERSPEDLSDKIMDQIRTLPQLDYMGSSSIFSGTKFFIVSGIVTAMVALISLFSSGYLSLEPLETTMGKYQLMEEWNFLKGVLTKRMLTNAMLLIYGVLGLALLDRAVLNPLFRKKAKRLSV
ncbi:MAG: hypothetical protein OER04_02200 [Cyclobacteriaceae bacterium]|nr:hypothetical protein [Cyclobacteriaceae bacterium]